ncbi:MAG TPA: ADOP family duplicated permease [Gemmatimonadaceae bacterium]|nr:ADOP family duplicated permease [Gemmatimonadaceae bacterium]
MKREPMWRRYVRLRGPDHAADVDEEVAFHLDERAAELRAAGLSADAARREALERFGDTLRYRRECVAIDRSRARHERALEWWLTTWRDTRVALRQYRRSPWFVFGSVTTLALGIGATLAMYRLVDAVVLRPLPGVLRPQELVHVAKPGMAYPSFRDVREATRATAHLAAYSYRPVTLRYGEETTRLTAHVVSGNYFSVLGSLAALGRPLVESDDAAAAPRAVVLSHVLWKTRFQSDSAVIGRVVSVNGSPATIVGVMAAGFRGTSLTAVPNLWLTVHGWFSAAPTYFSRLDLQTRDWGWLVMLGRLQPGQSPSNLVAALKAQSIRNRELFMQRKNAILEPVVISSVAAASGGAGGARTRSFLWVLLATAALVLLLAWVNVASLLIARGMQREREIGVRLALGADRKRLMRQLLTETALLALFAGAASLATAYVGTRLLGSVTIPGWGSFRDLSLGVGLGSAGVAVSFALGTSLLFGLMPALRATRRDVVAAITHGGFRAPRSARMRDALLVSQVSLTVALLIGAALFARGLQRALAIDPGFDPSHVAVTTVDLGIARYDSSRARTYLDGALERLRAIPGVTAVAWADALPLFNGENIESLSIIGEPPLLDDQRFVEIAAVSHGYFEALRIAPKLGRVFNESDHLTKAGVVVVNEAFAQQHGKGKDIVGRQLEVGGSTLTVIGVVRDVKYHRLDEQPRPFVYLPMARSVSRAGLWPVIALVRTDGRHKELPALVDATLRDFAPDVAPFDRQWLGDHYANALLPQRLSLLLLGVCSLLAFAIALVGIYSLASFFVVTHRRELALRLALGAQPQSVVRQVLGHGLVRVGIGVVAGSIAVVAGMRAARALLYGVEPTDPWALVAGAGLVLVAAMLAALVPARMAARMDAMHTLRQD